jgi:hypothetical protein
MTHPIDKIFAIRKAAVLIVIAASAITVSACSASSVRSAPAILPDSLNLPLFDDSQFIPECDVSKVLEISGNTITCVTLPFPKTVTTSSGRDTFAIDVARHYADAIISKDWTAVTEWPLVYKFEKPISDDCSETIQLLAWVVDEAKAPEDRNFPTSRITFIEKQTPVCGNKRKAK